MSVFFTHWLTQNLLVLAGFALLAWTLWSVSHHERWRRAWLRFRADRTGLVALVVVCLYLLLEGYMAVIDIPVQIDDASASLDEFIHTDSWIADDDSHAGVSVASDSTRIAVSHDQAARI